MHAVRLLGPVVLGLLAAASNGRAADPPKADAARPTKALLDLLLQRYKLYELPFPPADAPLVRVEGYRSGTDGVSIQHYYIGFHIPGTKSGDPGRVLIGAEPLHEPGRREVPKPVEPRPESLQETDDPSLELAVLCHARGWTGLAAAVLARITRDDEPLPETALADSAWDYWLSELRKPGTDRKGIARVLKVVAKGRVGKEAAEDERILDGLARSLVPGKGKPGTVEAVIDDLVEVTHTDRSELFPRADKMHPAYAKAARLGFDAVPALIAHLEDGRLTRAYSQGLNNFRGRHYMIGDVCCDLLQGLAGNELCKDWVRRLQEYRVDRAAVEAWWAGAKKVGEEAYFVRHVLGAKDGWVNELMLDVLAHKYPKRLPEVYRRMLAERPELTDSAVADAVAGAALPAETKRELFVEAARGKALDNRIDGIARLQEFDPAKALELLLAELDRVPETPAGNYGSCPESRLAGPVRQFNDPAAWAALEKTARRVDVGLRMEYLDAMTRPDLSPAERTASMAFLAKFLDDATVRDVAGSTKYEGPYAGFIGFPKIEVRNFAAQELAWFLDLDAEPKPEWTTAEWEKFRADVRRALDRERRR
jgi:hypothetical protein